MAKKSSRLSLGPKNPRHKTFQCNERRIHQTLNGALSNRRVNLTAREIYQSAGITSPTFYLHCRNSDDAMRRYERDLEQNFYNLIPRSAKRDTILTVLVVYIARHRPYFVAALKGCDYYLVQKVLKHYRLSLAGRKSKQEFVAYVGEIVTILAGWGKNSRFGQNDMSRCIKRLTSVH